MVYIIVPDNIPKDEIVVLQVILEKSTGSTIQKEVGPEKIIYCTAKYFGVSENDIVGDSRKKNVVFARQISIYLMENTLSLSRSEIGRIVNRDHSTVKHSIDSVTAQLESLDGKFVQDHLTSVIAMVYGSGSKSD